MRAGTGVCLEDVLISSIMLVCAVLLSLGVGVLVAHGICVLMFRLFRMHVMQVAAAKSAVKAGQSRLGVAGN